MYPFKDEKLKWDEYGEPIRFIDWWLIYYVRYLSILCRHEDYLCNDIVAVPDKKVTFVIVMVYYYNYQ